MNRVFETLHRIATSKVFVGTVVLALVISAFDDIIKGNIFRAVVDVALAALIVIPDAYNPVVLLAKRSVRG